MLDSGSFGRIMTFVMVSEIANMSPERAAAKGSLSVTPPRPHKLADHHHAAYGAATVLDSDFSSDADGVSDVENPYTFTGRRLDLESDLMQYRNRYYEPGLGRFISRDPVRYAGGPNLYAYAESRPTVHADASGFAWWWEIAKITPLFGTAINLVETIIKDIPGRSKEDYRECRVTKKECVGVVLGEASLAEVGCVKCVWDIATKPIEESVNVGTTVGHVVMDVLALKAAPALWKVWAGDVIVDLSITLIGRVGAIGWAALDAIDDYCDCRRHKIEKMMSCRWHPEFA